MAPDYVQSQPVAVLYEQLDDTCRRLFAANRLLVREYRQAIAMDGRRAALVRQLRLDTGNPTGATIIQRIQPFSGNGSVDDFTIIKFRERDLGVSQLLIEHKRARTFLRRLQDDSEDRMQHIMPPILQQSEANSVTLVNAIGRLQRATPTASGVHHDAGLQPGHPAGRRVKLVKVAPAISNQSFTVPVAPIAPHLGATQPPRPIQPPSISRGGPKPGAAVHRRVARSGTSQSTAASNRAHTVRAPKAVIRFDRHPA